MPSNIDQRSSNGVVSLDMPNYVHYELYSANAVVVPPTRTCLLKFLLVLMLSLFMPRSMASMSGAPDAALEYAMPMPFFTNLRGTHVAGRPVDRAFCGRSIDLCRLAQ